MTLDDDYGHAALLSRSAELRAWSEVLITRSQDACRAAHEVQQAQPHQPVLAPVTVTELFTILVDHHQLTVLDAVKSLAIHLAAAGYPDEAEVVSAADAVAITHAILADW
jgi:hypothetical protein